MESLPPTAGAGTPARRAAREPSGPPAPGGLGLASQRARERMVEAIWHAGVRDRQVLAALAQVPRHLFVDAGLASRAYEDVALPIGHGQTISRPGVVARMIELVAAGLPPERRRDAGALEVGTGCGYQAAVMAAIFGQVISIERIRELHEQARANLRALRVPNLRLVYGDGQRGVEQGAPYDAIIVAAAAGASVPEALLEQMRIGGRLVAPVSEDGRQALHLLERVSSGEWQLVVLDAVRFVPLRTGTA